MFALVTDGSITKYLNGNKGVTIGDIQYPKSIFTLWSNSQRENIGIYEVEFDDTNKKDEEYYINTNQSFNFVDGKVTASYGTATPKLLEDRNETNDDGSPMLDADGNQVVTKGLKSKKKEIIKNQASGLLEPTDWHNHKALDDDTYTIPENVKTYRANVRTKSNEMETQIDACTNVDELKALYEYTRQDDGTITRPLAEFPKEI